MSRPKVGDPVRWRGADFKIVETDDTRTVYERPSSVSKEVQDYRRGKCETRDLFHVSADKWPQAVRAELTARIKSEPEKAAQLLAASDALLAKYIDDKHGAWVLPGTLLPKGDLVVVEG